MKEISFIIPTLVAAALAAAPLAALAHEHRVYAIGGKDYSLTVGFLNEPVHTSDKSGVDLMVNTGAAAMLGEMGEAHPGSPVTGLEKTLKVEVSAGSEKKIFDLSPKYGAAGAYQAVIYPSVGTTYAFRIFGTLGDVPVDLAFPCDPSGTAAEDASMIKLSAQVTQKFKTGRFGCPADAADVTFPAPTFSVDALNERVKSLEAAVATPKSDPKATTALILGVLGLLAGVAALARKPKA